MLELTKINFLMCDAASADACNELMAYSLILSCCCYTCCIRKKLRKKLNIKVKRIYLKVSTWSCMLYQLMCAGDFLFLFFSGRLRWWFSFSFNVLLLCTCPRIAWSQDTWDWYASQENSTPYFICLWYFSVLTRFGWEWHSNFLTWLSGHLANAYS